MRPIEKMQELARRVSQGDARAMDDLRPGGTAEIVALGEQIAEMGASLENRRRYVQEFARHVSHEFKTPLTALRGAIEMFEDHGSRMTEEQRQKFLTNMDGDVDHLHRLTNSLQQLAKADMQEPQANASTNLNELLQTLGQRFQHQQPDYQLTLELPNEEVFAATSTEAIEAALTQIIDNALVHGQTASCIAITLIAEKSQAIIEVEDNGVGISEGNRAKVLQPFFTTAKDKGGTGLGLAIASRLIESQRGSLRLLPSKSGARFRIELRKASRPANPA